MSIWIGPAGELREFEPEAATPPEPADVVVGGTHVALTGARTVDLNGLRKSWSLSWQDLVLEQYSWLLAAYRRQLGPLYVVDLLSPNLLPPTLRLWNPAAGATAAAPADPFSRPLGSLDVGWAVPAGLHRSGPVPLIRDPAGHVPPMTGSVAVDTAGITLVLEALGRDAGTVVATTPAVTATAPPQPLTRSLSDFADPLPSTAAFIRLAVQVPTGAATRAWQAQVAVGAQPYTPPGGSARVVVDSWDPRQVDPPAYAVAVKLEAL